MKKNQKSPQWTITKRLRRKAKRKGIKMNKAQSTKLIKWSK